MLSGVGLTTFALLAGLWNLKTGDTKMSQKMMRLRVFAQGSTLFALLGGVYYEATKSKKASKT